MDFLQLVRQKLYAEQPQQMPLVRMVQDAKEDWIYAKRYFNMVDDVDLIDYAVYRIAATERKYMYLLKDAKQEGATANIVHSLYCFNKR